MEILFSVFVWLLSIAESILVVVLSFVLLIVLIVGLSLESIFQEDNSSYCEDLGIQMEFCEPNDTAEINDKF